MARIDQDHDHDDIGPESPHDSLALERFFAAARDSRPAPSAALMARILADAEAELGARGAVAAQPAPRPGLLAAVVAALGGWPAMAGLATATVAGVWLGFAAPDGLNAVSGGLVLPGAEAAYGLDDLLPGFGDLAMLTEEG